VYVNARRKDHWTPLHLASHCGKPEVARLLLAHGANAHAEDDFFRTPLHQVARGHCHNQADGVRISKLLLESGADVNAQDINRETPLHLASASGKLEIVRVLLENATAKDYRGQSPSHLSFEGESHPQK
jgi:ankyrin